MNETLRELAEQLTHREWYVLGPPWVGFTDTFTILAGSPDPHVGEPILETCPIDDADETEDHYRQDALAQWLQRCDPNAVIALLDTIDTQSARIADLEAQLAEAREDVRKLGIGMVPVSAYVARAFMEGRKDD